MAIKLGKWKTAKLAAIILLVFLSLSGLSSSPIVRAESNYPFKAVFERDLSSIARHAPNVEGIQVSRVFNFIGSVEIRISYSPVLSDLKKISIQDEVQEDLREKSYIQSVGRNGITCLHLVSLPDSCPPWPGFVIGELMVMFVDVPADPFFHPWPDGSSLVVSNVGTTHLTLTWTGTKDGSHTVAYLMTGSYNQWLTVSNTTHAMVVTGLIPGTNYDFRVDAINDQGDHWWGPRAFAVTQTESVPPSYPTTGPTPGPAIDQNSNQIFSAFLKYWYALLLGISASAVSAILFLRGRKSPTTA